MNETFFNPAEIILTLGRNIIPLIIFLSSAYYLSKKSKLTSLLLAIGSFVNLLTSIIFGLMSYFVNVDFYSSMNFSLIQSVSYIGNLAFAAGFVMLILETIKLLEKKPIENSNF